jgi:hypothetical protein
LQIVAHGAHVFHRFNFFLNLSAGHVQSSPQPGFLRFIHARATSHVNDTAARTMAAYF